MIDKPFAYHKPSDDGHARITTLREAFSVVQRAIEETCPPSRQKSVAITELETAAMWAIKAVVFNDPASEVETGLHRGGAGVARCHNEQGTARVMAYRASSVGSSTRPLAQRC